MNISQYKQMGFKIDNSTMTSKEYDIYIDNICQSYAEGIWSATTNTVKNGYFIASKSLSMLWQLIKKLISAIIQIFHKGYLSVKKGFTDLKSLIEPLKKLQEDLKDATVMDGNVYTSYTVMNLNAAGWLLEPSQKPEDNRILYRIVGLFTSIADDDSILDQFFKLTIKNNDDLFKKLEYVLKLSLSYLKAYPEYTKYMGWSNTYNKVLNRVNRSNQSGYSYRNLKPESYGQFVAYVACPVGSFINLEANKNNIGDRAKEQKSVIKLMTPKKTSNIPALSAQKEFSRTAQYMSILINYLVKLNIEELIRKKEKELNNMLKNINEISSTLNNSEDQESSRNNKADGNTSTNSNGTVDYKDMQNNNQGNQNNTNNQTQGQSQSFIDSVLYDLHSYSEDISDTSFDNDLNTVSQQMNNVNNNQNVDTSSLDKIEDTTSKDNYDQQDKSLKQDVDSVNKETVDYGLKYLQSLLKFMNKLTFNELETYYSITGVIYKTTKEFIDYCNNTFLTNDGKEDPDAKKNDDKNNKDNNDNGNNGNNDNSNDNDNPNPNKPNDDGNNNAEPENVGIYDSSNDSKPSSRAVTVRPSNAVTKAFGTNAKILVKMRKNTKVFMEKYINSMASNNITSYRSSIFSDKKPKAEGIVVSIVTGICKILAALLTDFFKLIGMAINFLVGENGIIVQLISGLGKLIASLASFESTEFVSLRVSDPDSIEKKLNELIEIVDRCYLNVSSKNKTKDIVKLVESVIDPNMTKYTYFRPGFINIAYNNMELLEEASQYTSEQYYKYMRNNRPEAWYKVSNITINNEGARTSTIVRYKELIDTLKSYYENLITYIEEERTTIKKLQNIVDKLNESSMSPDEVFATHIIYKTFGASTLYMQDIINKTTLVKKDIVDNLLILLK